MADDILIARGPADGFNGGSLTAQDQAIVLTASRERLLTGWPDWHFRATDPIDAPFNGYLNWSGSALIYDGNPVLVHPLKGPFVLGQAGYISNVVSEHRGTFEDFAIFEWDVAAPYLGDDPVEANVRADNAGVTSGSGNITSAWTRHYRVLYPPKKARYAVPKISTGNIGASKGLYLDGFQFETLDINDDPAPSAWVPPRHIRVRVRPTRLNYSTNPSFVVSTAGIGYDGAVTLTRDTGFAWTGQASLKVVVGTATAPVRVGEDQDIDVVSGEDFAISFYCYVPATLSGSYRVMVRFYTIAGVLVGTEYGSTLHDRTQVGWDRQSLVTRVPQGAHLAQVSFVSSETAPTSTDTFYLDGVLIEKVAVIRPYFDGSFGEDYLWKQGGTPGLTHSYWYEDRVKRHYILERTLRENVPLGVSISDPEYGEELRSMTPYGQGPYGSGPYGG